MHICINARIYCITCIRMCSSWTGWAFSFLFNCISVYLKRVHLLHLSYIVFFFYFCLYTHKKKQQQEDWIEITLRSQFNWCCLLVFCFPFLFPFCFLSSFFVWQNKVISHLPWLFLIRKGSVTRQKSTMTNIFCWFFNLPFYAFIM